MSLNQIILGNKAHLDLETDDLKVDGNLTVSGTINGSAFPEPPKIEMQAYPVNLVSYASNGTNSQYNVVVSDSTVVVGLESSYVTYNFQILFGPGSGATQQQLWIETSFYPLFSTIAGTAVGHASIRSTTSPTTVYNASIFNINESAGRIEVDLPTGTLVDSLYTANITVNWRTTYVPA